MSTGSITRREMLLLVGFALTGFSRAGAHAAEQSGGIDDALLQMARRLFPHGALGDAIYLDALKPLQAKLAADPKFAEALQAGCYALDLYAGGDWLGADREIQIAALKSIETSPVFQKVQNAVRVELYDNPAVWRLLGFEGSSVEFGGYIDRGFDDIDWLPSS